MNDVWLIMLITNMLIPVIMIVFGMLFSKKIPKTINALFGYRTTRSMKNEDTWAFAHHFIGRIWTKLGIIILILSLLMMILLYNKEIEIIALYGVILTFFQLALMIIPIYKTEKELRLTFDESGKRL